MHLPPSALVSQLFEIHCNEKRNYFLWGHKTEGSSGLQIFLAICYQFKQTAHHSTMHDLHGHDSVMLSFCILNPLNKKHVCFPYIRTRFIPHSKHCLPWLYKTNLLMLYKAKSPFVLSSIYNT